MTPQSAQTYKTEMHLAGELDEGSGSALHHFEAGSRGSYGRDPGQKRYITEIIAWQLIAPGKDAAMVSTTGAEITDDDVAF